MTPYNQLQNQSRALMQGRQIVADPGSGGTVKEFPSTTQGVLSVSSAGTRTLQDPTQLALGYSLLAVSSAASVVISASSVSYAINAGEYAEFVVVLNSSAANVWGLRRSSFNAAATIVSAIPVTEWRNDAALQTVLATAGTSSTQFTLNSGTYATNAADLQVKAAGTGSVSIAARVQQRMPLNYAPGTNITITASVTRTTAATTNGTLLFAAYEQAAPTANLIATAAADINATASSTVTATITGTSLVPGSLLDIRALVATDGGASTAGEWHITKVTLTYTKSN